jgi:uroporphyrinogen-III synthase
MPQEAKYFCSSEQIAFYLQKYIQYRKRKVVYANGTLTDFQNILAKHRATEKFIMPCSSVGVGQLSQYLKTNKFDFSEAIMYKMIPNQDIKRRNFDYDLVAFFNIEGVKAFFTIFTDFKQGKTIIGAFGEATQKELEKRGYRVLVKAPQGEIKSMVMAIEQLFKDIPTLSR